MAITPPVGPEGLTGHCGNRPGTPKQIGPPAPAAASAAIASISSSVSLDASTAQPGASLRLERQYRPVIMS